MTEFWEEAFKDKQEIWGLEPAKSIKISQNQLNRFNNNTTKGKQMTNYFRITLTLLCILMLTNVSAQKKVTYGKSTFTVYQPLPDLAPTPLCGFAPETPGYTLKSKLYGPGTYYCYAPGNVVKTNYKCILTEIRDWVAYRPETVKELAALKGLKQLSEKEIKKMCNKTRLPNGGLMYQLTENSWIWFYVIGLQNCGPKAWASNEEHVLGVSYIEKVPQETGVVVDRLYRFWNDGVKFADYAGVNQSNFKTQPTAPGDKNPNNFAIGDVLNPKKGFYTLSFDGGVAPTYLWHPYEKVVEENLKKADFDAMGTVGFDDLFTAFEYQLDVIKAGKNLYFSYSVNSRFLLDLVPGVTWQKEMAQRKENEANRKVEMQKLYKANGAALEKLYKEIFK
jgi:hypothetical protein